MRTETGGFQEEPNAALAPLADLARRFQIRERLDHGRLGTVYRAIDKHRTNAWGEPCEVALLIVPAEIVRNPERLRAVGRVFEEVQRLRHRHIAGLNDFGREGATHFMTMELVDGESLRSVMDSLQPELISRQEALGVVRAVGEALLYAHDAGVVHGDVRAENVLVAPRQQVKLLFSAACLVNTGPFPVERRDDVCALAALAYELLSGTKPPTHPGALHGGHAAADAPAPIKGLSRQQWKALRAALAGRDDRGRGVGALLDGLGLTRGLRRAPRRHSRWSDAAGPLLRRAAVACLLMAGVVLGARGLLRLGPDRITETAGSWYGSAQDAVRQYAIAPAMGLVDRLRTEGPSQAPSRSSSTPEPTALPKPGTPAPQAGGAPPPGSAATQPGDARTSGAPPSAGAPLSGGASASGPTPQFGGPTPRANASGPANDGAERAKPDSEAAASSGAHRPEANPASTAGGDRSTGEAEQQGESRQSQAQASSSAGASAATQAPTPAPDQSAEQAETKQGAAAPAEAQTLSFAEERVVVSEDRTVAVVKIVRSSPKGALRFVLWTSDGTAVAGDDYGDVGRVVDSFRDGEVSRTVFIPITNDSVPEGRESFYVHMSRLGPDGRQQGPLQTAEIVIVDDDS